MGLPPAILGLRVHVMISQERKEYLLDLWFEETNEDWTQEWRDALNEAEATLAARWDRQECQTMCQLLNRIQKFENN